MRQDVEKFQYFFIGNVIGLSALIAVIVFTAPQKKKESAEQAQPTQAIVDIQPKAADKAAPVSSDKKVPAKTEPPKNKPKTTMPAIGHSPKP